MEQATDCPIFLEAMSCPAFTVKDGIINRANQAALQRQLPLDAPVSRLISIGQEDYAQFSSGKLCLTIRIQDIQYNTTVTKAGSEHLFCMKTPYAEPELRAFALAAQYLREPLANAMIGTELLLPNDAIREDPEARNQLGQVNRSLHRLLRAISNMSDMAQYKHMQLTKLQSHNATAVFDELLDKASHLISQAGRTLHYKVPQQSVYCMLDVEKLERAVLNLLSNAAKYAPAESDIHAALQCSGNQLRFTVTSSTDGAEAKLRNDIFNRFLREPGLEDGRSGIGLGISIIHSVAAAHGGTVLYDMLNGTDIRFTMTIALKNPNAETVLRSPVRIISDYAGGRDRCLLELSDILPDKLYKDCD